MARCECGKHFKVIGYTIATGKYATPQLEKMGVRELYDEVHWCVKCGAYKLSFDKAGKWHLPRDNKL